MKYYAVIDTNVIVSGLLKKNSIPEMVLASIYTNNIVPLLNDEIVDEYERVLSSKKFDFNEELIKKTIQTVCSKAIYLNSKEFEDVMVDEKDVVFYGVTLTAKENFDLDAYLVTGNIRHFPKKEFVVTPREMLMIILKDN